jgi:predicted metal-dependent peptidase
MKKLDNEEMLKIAQRLENYHAVFYQLFEMGNPIFTNSIPTACVKFDEYGSNVGFEISPKFWKTLHGEQKPFVVAHETLHVLLSHGMRMVNTKNAQACNIAMDVVVNELLVNKFGFNRVEVDPKNNYIWRNKIFPKGTVKKSQSFEYYYNHLKSLAASSSGKKKMKGFGSTVDDHSKMKGGSLPQDVIERLKKKLSKDEKEQFGKAVADASEEKDSDKAGTVAGQLCEVMPEEPAKISFKWKKILLPWTKKHMSEEVNEQWIRTNRRLANVDSSIFLPSEMEEQEAPDKKLATIFLFLDTSGSCKPIAKRFWTAYRSIPKELFDVKLFCFDTQTYEVDPKKRELFGFGGTRFYPIESRVQLETKGKKYPDAVWVFTDGQGSSVSPEKPERWHWFLTDHDYRNCIPRKSKVYKLSDFE